MLTLFAWFGRLSWPVLGSLLPGISPKVIMVLAGFLAVLVAVGGPAGAVWLHMHGKQREAVNLAHAACELRITEGAAASAQALSEVLATIRAGDAAAEEPQSDPEELALCRKSKLCRENGR